jgi:hypothetical protein
MSRIKCPKCEAPKMHTQFIRTPYESAEEIAYACGAKMKYDAKREKKWIRECGFRIHNDYN